MKIVCPSCTTSYDVTGAKLGAGGRVVRCAKCGNSWHATIAAANAPAEEEFNPDDWGLDSAADVAAEPAEAATMDGTILPPAVEHPAGSDDESEIIDGTRSRFEMNADSRSSRSRLGGFFQMSSRRRRRVIQQLVPAWLRPMVSGAPMLALAVSMFVVVLVAHQPIVRLVPDLASAYKLIGLDVNLRGLSFQKLQTFREFDDGSPVLVVEGTVVNMTNGIKSIPKIRLALRGTDAQEIYAWTVEPAAKRLRANGTVRFRTRIAAPPDSAADIHLRFIGDERQVATLK